jgi:hypothetical protein
MTTQLTPIMKKYIRWLALLIAVPAILFVLLSFQTSHLGYEPVLMTRDALESAVQLRESREIEQPGKIWVYDNFIFVIEQYRGIHVIDNTDTSNPVNLAFIQVDGCTDVAVNQGLIYANNAVDLIGIRTDLDQQSITVVSRNREVLPEISPPDGWSYFNFNKYRPDNTIIVRYEPYTK